MMPFSKNELIYNFNDLNKKSFLLKYIKLSKKKISLSFLGLSHKNNIEYSNILKNINLNYMCLFIMKNNLLPYLLNYVNLNYIKSFFLNTFALNFFFNSIYNFNDLLKLEENKSLIFFYFLIRNKIYLNKNRIINLNLYKSLLIFSFSNIYYNNLNILNYHLYLNSFKL